MKIIKNERDIFPYIAYIPDNVKDSPALLFQLHGAGERGCGGGMAWNAASLTMPVWAFHGLDDKTVSPSQTIEMVEKLKTCNADVKYNLYEGVGHDSWNNAFCEQTLLWLLSKSKAE